MSGLWRRGRNGRQRGFTLLELMVVVVIIGILASVGIPSYRKFVQKGHMEEAMPYLMQVVSKERIYKVQNGKYFQNTDEQDLEDNLGVDLRDAADFCFVVICRPNASDPAVVCTSDGSDTTGSTDGYATGSNPANPHPELEVWAILRGTGQNENATANGCTTADSKLDANGHWETDGGDVSVGRAIVMRYPAPPDGIDGDWDWQGGITYSDVWASSSLR